MSTIITHGADVIYPTAVSDYASARESGNLVKPIPGRPNPDVTLRPANLRTGALTLTFTTDVASLAAEELHAAGGVFTVRSDSATIDMYYIANGSIGRAHGAAGQWVVTVDFQEIVP